MKDHDGRLSYMRTTKDNDQDVNWRVSIPGNQTFNLCKFHTLLLVCYQQNVTNAIYMYLCEIDRGMIDWNITKLHCQYYTIAIILVGLGLQLYYNAISINMLYYAVMGQIKSLFFGNKRLLETTHFVYWTG